MKSVKPVSLTAVPFVQGGNLNQIAFQPGYATKKVLFNLSGNIVLSGKNGTLVAAMQAAADGTTLFPYLLRLFGNITFNGTCKAGKGFKLNNIPAWVLWLMAYIQNKGVGPVVNDGGMAAAGFANGTYAISIDVPVYFYDPMTPKSQHPYTFFRPVRYNKDTTFQINGGKLFATPYLANTEGVAVTGDSTGAPALTVDVTGLTMSATAFTVPDMPQGQNDLCADLAYEWNPQFDVTNSEYNGISLADLELQEYIYLINTVLAAANGAGTNLVESGSDTFGSANRGVLETKAGAKVIANPYAVNQKAQDYDEFLTSVSALPAGLLIIDEYDHSLNDFEKKTFMDPNAPQHIVNGWGTAAVDGSNFYLMHVTAQFSTSQIAKVGKFPMFAGS